MLLAFLRSNRPRPGEHATGILPLLLLPAMLLALLPCAALAKPIQPASDDELVEILPASSQARRMASRSLAASGARAAASGLPARGTTPISLAPALAIAAADAVQKAEQLLHIARTEDDPRAAGQALALLAPWHNDAQAPAALIVIQATVEQFLHQFDTARNRLQALVQRDPRQAQAWLTLATLHRLRGDYAESDKACRAVVALQVALHGQACLAENQALRGQVDAARNSLQALIQSTSDADSRAWLFTTLAELEQRDLRTTQADAAFRSALAASPDGYTALAYADFLIAQGRGARATEVLQKQPRSDAVLIRLVVSGRQADSGKSAKPAHGAGHAVNNAINHNASELAERFAQAALRPGAAAGHAREQALYALDVQRDPVAALRFAQANVVQQREPIDLLLLARAARAAKSDEATAATARLKKEMSLHDRRLDALL